ncbi:MAG: serine/threonine protein kinase [Polyangiaceae bacterium]|nr:serine/threonine protein kinase [Polyangiaceae bacterium]MCL4750887.1 serine/threonine protein kinase [Myxococcales bacterium]
MAASEPTAVIPAELGPFSIQGVLGEGGSAVVYAALWNGEEVALKVPRERELTPREQERFLEEAKMLERVRHRAVVEVLGSGRLPDGLPYLVMRRCEGETLADHLSARGALGLAHALDLFEQLASAVEALHDAGLLHRDLKPENLLLVDGARAVKLLDFGIAKEIDAPASTTTQAGIARGTPATMAPERFFGAPASKSTDVYELAVVFYAMLVGRLPWSDVTNVQARLNPLSPLEAGAAVPDTLSGTVMEALSTRPERRPDGVSALVRRVRESVRTGATTGRVTAATSISAPPPPLFPQKSEDAQVIESRRDLPAHKGSARTIASVAALALIAVGAVAVIGLRTSATPASPTPSADPPAPAAAPLAPTEPERAAELPSAEPAPEANLAPTPASPRGKPIASSAPSAAPTASAKPPPPKGKPKGAPCTRSSECASMVCAAEVCQ